MNCGTRSYTYLNLNIFIFTKSESFVMYNFEISPERPFTLGCLDDARKVIVTHLPRSRISYLFPLPSYTFFKLHLLTVK